MHETPLETDFFARLAAHGSRVATHDDDDGPWSYRQLLSEVDRLAATLLAAWPADSDEPRQRTIAIDVLPSNQWLVALLAVWRAGGIAVPLAVAHPERELEYTLDDSGVIGGSGLVIASDSQAPRLANLVHRHGLRLIAPGSGETDRETIARPPVPIDDAAPAILIYTSGTTGQPKGVPIRHGSLRAQLTAMAEAWGWSADDRIVEVLPLHHVHGIVNVVLCALWSGASVRILPRFDAGRVWETFCTDAPSLFMAVPTIYNRLLAAWEAAPPATRDRWSKAAGALRLCVSGSAALPVPTLERWQAITDHVLLERYGMSEIGMGLSNPLVGDRLPGTVGQPLPGVETQIVDATGQPVAEGVAGELEVRGRSVFAGYWYRPEATAEAFREAADGRRWFRTGDVAVVENGVFRLLGRSSVDILKTGGEKVSALEVEAVLREHPAIGDVAVVGLPDPEWGQRLVAAIERSDGTRDAFDERQMRAWAKKRLAVYKVPTTFRAVAALPRNALGKVQKPKVARLFDNEAADSTSSGLS